MKKDLVMEDLERFKRELELEEIKNRHNKRHNNSHNNKYNNKNNDVNNNKTNNRNDNNIRNKNKINKDNNDDNYNNNDDNNDDGVEGRGGFLKLKRYGLILLTIFLVLLMLSFIYLSAPVYTYVYGLAGSSRINESNEAIFKNLVVVSFDEDVISFLQEVYDPLGDEKAVCLLGELNNNNYVVNDYYLPRVFDSAWNRVSHSPCSDETIIMLHTHPFKRCNPSDTDRNTLRVTKVSNPDIIMMVMCGRERFSAVI